MKCTCDDCLNDLIDNTGSEKRFYVTPVITEMEFTECFEQDTIESIQTTLTFALKPPTPEESQKIIDELLKNSKFFWLDLKTGKKYPIE